MTEGLALAERVMGSTLGPCGHSVAMTRAGRPFASPELLADAATIGRRLLSIPGGMQNAGLMLARHAALRQQEAHGDGVATTVVLAAAAARALQRRAGLAASGVGLRAAFEAAIAESVERIAAMARPVDDEELLALAERCVDEPATAQVVMDVLTRSGPDAVIVTRDAPHDDVRSQFVDGSLWEARVASSTLLEEGGTELSLPACHVLVWDGELDAVDASAALLATMLQAGARSGLIVARAFSPSVVGLFSRNRALLPVGAVLAPAAGANQRDALDDIALLAGTAVRGPDRGDRLSGVDAGMLGSLRRARVGARHLDLSADRVDQGPVRARRDALARRLDDEEDEGARRELRERLGRLDGGMAIIWVGGRTTSEREMRRAQVDQGIRRLRAAARHGTVPGAGASLLGLGAALDGPAPGDARIARAALLEAVERPAWWLAANAWPERRSSVRVDRHGAPDRGLDVLTGQVVDLRPAGIVDAAATIMGALRSAGSVASVAMSVGAALVRADRAPIAWRP